MRGILSGEVCFVEAFCGVANCVALKLEVLQGMFGLISGGGKSLDNYSTDTFLFSTFVRYIAEKRKERAALSV